MTDADRNAGPGNDEITVIDQPDAGRYEAHLNGELAAFVTYRRSPGRIVFIHTETLDGFTGRGVASHLVRTVLDEARRQGLQVVPRCPYVARFIAEHAEYQDLVRAN
jgi:predicted GNAT family acetyltransferase